MLSPEAWEECRELSHTHCISHQVHLPAGRSSEDARGLFWVLDEEVRVEGSSDSVVLERLRTAFEKKSAGADGEGDRGRDGGTSCLQCGSLPIPAGKGFDFFARQSQYLGLF